MYYCQANSNLRVKKINHKDAECTVYRSHLNQKAGATYFVGDEFECIFGDDSGLFLRDSKGVRIFVSPREEQCFDVK